MVAGIYYCLCTIVELPWLAGLYADSCIGVSRAVVRVVAQEFWANEMPVFIYLLAVGSKLVQLLLKNDLVDELWLLIYPLTLGEGKKLFDDGAVPTAFSLVESLVTPKGVIIANYARASEVKTGTVGA
jgi:dihydrofolate reductase